VERSEDGPRSRRQIKATGRTGKGLLAILFAIAILSVFAPAAWAHGGMATIGCKKVKYSYVDFPAKPGNTVHEAVFLNGIKETTDNFTFDGSTGTNTLAIDVSGSASVEAEAHWNTNGVTGSFKETQEVTGCIIN
jgi:hypothetical protein